MARIKRNTRAKILLEDVKKEFLDVKESTGRSKPTLDNYRISIDKFIEYVGNVEISSLGIGNIIAFRRHMQKEEVLKLASMNHYLRDIRTFLNFAYESNYITEKIKVELIRGQEEVKEGYTEEELEKLLVKPSNIDNFIEWRTYTMVCFMLATGQRINTISNITIGDVDLINRLITIRAAKNKKSRDISIDKTLANILKNYIRDWRSEAESENEFLFCNYEGNKLTTNAIQQALRKYNLSRGVEKTSAHLMRNTFAKMYILNGGSEFRLQKMLGHSTLEMTRHYVELTGLDLKRDIDTVSPLVSMVKNKGGIEHKITRKKK